MGLRPGGHGSVRRPGARKTTDNAKVGLGWEHSFYTLGPVPSPLAEGDKRGSILNMASSRAAALTAEERFSQTKGDYTSRDIQVLEGIQPIRLRPAMYIGSTSTSGLVHLIWEALDNAVDEAVAGYGNQIWVEIDKAGVVRVQDEGRGMPFDLMTYHGKKLPTATVLRSE